MPETRRRECRKLNEKADLNEGKNLFANSSGLLSKNLTFSGVTLNPNP